MSDIHPNLQEDILYLDEVLTDLRKRLPGIIGRAAMYGATIEGTDAVDTINDLVVGIYEETSYALDDLETIPHPVVQPARKPIQEPAAPAPVKPIAAAIEREETPVEPETPDTTISLIDAVTEFARSHESFRIEDLRKKIPEIAALPKDEYELFKHSFTTHRSAIAAVLREGGVQASWTTTGKARGTRYMLVIGESVEMPAQEIETSTVSMPPVTTPETRIEDLREQRLEQTLARREQRTSEEIAAQFTLDVVEALKKRFTETGCGDTFRLKGAADFIAQNLELGREIGVTVISQLLETGLIHDGGTERGMRMLTFNESVSTALRESAMDRTEQKSKDDPLTPSQINALFAAMDYLSQPGRHFQQAETIGKLFTEAQKTNPDLTEDEFRIVIRRGVETGKIVIIQQKKYGRGRKGATIRFASNELKRTWQQNDDARHSLLDELTSADPTESI